MIRLRPYMKSDEEAVLSWCDSEDTFFKWTFGLLGGYPITGEKFQKTGQYMQFTAVDDDEPVGYFIARNPNGKLDELRFGYGIVRPDRRNQGVGKAMLSLGLVYAFEVYGADRVTLGVYEKNDNAISCYRSIGFAETGKLENYLIDGSNYQVFEMEYRKENGMAIRNVEPKDMEFILELNKTNVEVLSPMDQAKFSYFDKCSDMFQVAEVNGEPAAFLIALREGLEDYTSENYIWFSGQYDRFLYVDRIVIDEKFRGMGLGRKIYEGVFDRAAKAGLSTVTAEIDIEPYNEPSLKFHEAMGFEEVGQQVIRGGEIKVSLQARAI